MMSLFAERNAGENRDLYWLLHQAADRLERYALWAVVVFAALYVVATIRFSAWRPLWLDEIGTYYVSRLSPPGRIIQALKTDADVQPPLFNFLTHPLALTGSELLLRLPAMVGVLCMSIGLYLFVSRRLTRIHGLLAMSLPLVTEARSYCSEARPYGAVLGAATAMMVCWQSANDGKHRLPAVIGMWFFSTFAVSVHYFGMLVLMPFLLAETVKWWRNRRPDWPVIAVLASALLPLAAAWPVIRAVRALGVRSLYHVRFPGSVVDTYNFLLEAALVPGVELVLIALVWMAWMGRRSAGPEAVPEEPAHRNGNVVPETAVICGFVVLPLAGLVLGKVVGAFMPRYVLGATIGFCAGLP
jgi:hypothetical protein